jgi:uncharacterized damage-inducible protein DinB
MRISDTFLPEWDHEMATTRRVLDRVPFEKWDWRPHAKSFTMGDLATHLSNIPGWVAEVVGKDDLDIAPPGQPPYKPPKYGSKDELLAAFDKNVAAGRAALAGAENDHLMKPWSLLSGGQTMFTLPRTGVLRSLVMNHAVHHRAQLGVYMRLLDVPVPSMYGPSADEAAAIA